MTIKVRLLAAIIFSIAILLFFMMVRYFVLYYYKFNIFLIGDETISIEVGDNYVEPGYEIIPKREDIQDKIIITDNIITNKIGEYEVNYIYNNSNREIKKTRKVIVKDSTPPVIKVNGSTDIYTIKNVEIKTPSCTAIDNYDGDISDKITIYSNIDYSTVGVYQLSCVVNDSSGNTAKNTINVHVEETKEAYIEVAIKKQKLYYYEFNNLVLESDIVTGYGDSTPYGTFNVINKARNIILRGRDYNSFVEYWIDFKGHVYGFHDASWRNKFGGEIYLKNGSHGCVNMPKDNVAKLYELVEIGTPVYIHS